MADTKTAVAHKPVWIDLSSTDAEGSRDFYSKLFGWNIEVNPDPQYGGYGMAKIGGKDVAGIGPAMAPGTPSAWMVYIGTPDTAETVKKVESAGGKVVTEMAVGEQGTMAVFQDPGGAIISTWQPKGMVGAQVTGAANTYGWAELNSRGFDQAAPFYKTVFGWGEKRSPMGEGQGDYTEFQLAGESIAGGMEMNPMVPAEVPNYWMVYFSVADVDEAFEKAKAAGGTEMLAPQDFPGGRFAILSDPQGASFGLMSMPPAK